MTDQSHAAISRAAGWSETILRLKEGEAAPEGWEIRRIIGEYIVPTGAGTNCVRVYAVAVRRV